MKKNIFLFILLITSQLAFSQDQKAKTILDAVKLKYQSLTAFKASFVYSIESKTAGTAESLKGEITLKGKSFFLKLPEQEIITDGKTQWTFMKDANEVNVTDYEPDADEITPDRIYTVYETNYEYSYIEEKFENGKHYHIIDLKPKNKNANVFKIRLKIVKDANSIKSWEIFERNSNRYLYTKNSYSRKVT